jgi:Type II secretion system (T2SS), protein M subtype b
MSESLSRILRRLAAIGLLLAAVGVVAALLVLPPAGHFSELRADIVRQRDLLARFEAFAANKGAAEDLAGRSQAAMQSGIFLTGETDALRTANLQALITDIAVKHGVRLSSARALPAHERDGLRFIGVQAELDADMRQLQAIMLAFEAQRPYLFIQSLQVAPVSSRRPDSDDLKIRFGIVAAAVGGDAKL